ncbi:MAG TPA: hypothetical protein VGL41_02035 [Roseiarcus sp.]|jgi:hypothetical protein
MAAGRELDAFRACCVPDGRRLGGLPWIEISQALEGQSSLLVGKNAGNFAESASFHENPSRKHLQIQLFVDEFPTSDAGNFLTRAGIYSDVQGIWREIDPRVSTYRPHHVFG